MGESLTIEQLLAIAEKTRKTLRAQGEFPKRRRRTPRTKEKDEALFLLRLNASIKYGVKRFPDGTFRIQGKGKTDICDSGE